MCGFLDTQIFFYHMGLNPILDKNTSITLYNAIYNSDLQKSYARGVDMVMNKEGARGRGGGSTWNREKNKEKEEDILVAVAVPRRPACE